jgi:hypothetical protein
MNVNIEFENINLYVVLWKYSLKTNVFNKVISTLLYIISNMFAFQIGHLQLE